MQRRTKISPSNQVLRHQEPNHAIFETLYGPGLIERFDVYKLHTSKQDDTEYSSPDKNEIVQAVIRLGHKLNGHPTIIHGGIIALLFDEVMGWARFVWMDKPDVMYVTANLNVNYRSPLKENSSVVLRVFCDGGDETKMKFVGQLEGYDDGMIYADASGLFVRVRSKL